MHDHNFPQIVVIGEILFDLIDGVKHLGGAPFNFAYHLLRLGFDVRFISRIGNDANGKEIIHILNRLNFPVNDIQEDPELNTGTVIVDIDDAGSPRFDIVAPVAYDHIEFIEKKHLSILNDAACVYFGSLVQRSAEGRLNIRQFLEHAPSSGICFYDINLRPASYDEALIRQSLIHTTTLKLNDEELVVLKQFFQADTESDRFVKYLMDRFEIDRVILTKGDKGSILYDKTGTYPSESSAIKQMADSVGAGDAFAAMFCAATLNNWQPKPSLSAASAFASRICEIRGAIPDSDTFYAPYKKMFEKRSLHGSF